VSLVVFPFKTEKPEVVVNNIRTAAGHERVDEVLCVGVTEEETYAAIAEAGPRIAAETATPVNLILQERIGSLRPGKGDGMNTALRYFVDKTDAGRLHFYDSDITSFNEGWITKAEEFADLGYDVVRHYFPRAATDAMITWFITRVGFALLWPRSELPWIEQPLGGELLMTREVAERLVADEAVQAQSDWGVDTLYTFRMIQGGATMIEAYVREGKAHKLYGRLTDLRSMLVECFAAIQSLQAEPVNGSTLHRVQPPDVVPSAIMEKLGYDIEASMSLLTERWSERQEEYLELFPVPLRDGMLANQQRARFGFMDEAAWYDVYCVLLKHFDRDDNDWQELLFKMWITRVLQYTTTAAARGYAYGMRYLRAMVERYLRQSALAGDGPR
jgi:mannosylglycerate synthase